MPDTACAPPSAAIPLLYATIDAALFSIRVLSKLYSWNFNILVNGSSPPNILTRPCVIPPTKLPSPATAEPAPNAAIPRAIAPMPLPASINFCPSSVSKLFSPSAIFGNDAPTIHVAPAIAPPISTIAAASPAAPNATVGLANALIPPARPLSIPPRPLPNPLPILPSASPAPLPADPFLPAVVPGDVLPKPTALSAFSLTAPPTLLASAPTTALAANRVAIPATTAAITPAAPKVSPISLKNVNTDLTAPAANFTPSSSISTPALRPAANSGVPIIFARSLKASCIVFNTPLVTNASINPVLISLTAFEKPRRASSFSACFNRAVSLAIRCSSVIFLLSASAEVIANASPTAPPDAIIAWAPAPIAWPLASSSSLTLTKKLLY